MKITERILQILEYKGITEYKFNKDLGFSNGFLNKSREISTDKYANILSYFPDVNPYWLLTGKGQMLKQQEKTISQSIVGDHNIGGNVGGNVSGAGISSITDLVDIIKKQQEQIGKLIETVNNLSHK